MSLRRLFSNSLNAFKDEVTYEKFNTEEIMRSNDKDPKCKTFSKVVKRCFYY